MATPTTAPQKARDADGHDPQGPGCDYRATGIALTVCEGLKQTPAPCERPGSASCLTGPAARAPALDRWLFPSPLPLFRNVKQGHFLWVDANGVVQYALPGAFDCAGEDVASDHSKDDGVPPHRGVQPVLGDEVEQPLDFPDD